jgi:uncharacterized protein
MVMHGPDRDLLDAIAARDPVRLSQALARGANPNARDAGSGLTALMLAAGQGDAACVDRLLAAGADVFTKDARAGAAALHKACQAGSLPVVRQLVEAGAFIDDIVVSTGHTPLFEAIWFKQPEIVAFLLERGAGINLSTHYGFALLDHLAYALKVNRIDQDKLERVAALVETRKNADTDAAARQSLMKAVHAGDRAGVRSALDAGAVVDERAPVLNGFDDDHTPLLVACRDGHGDIAADLLAAGADVNATEPTFGAVPLHKATYNGHAAITQLLAGQPGVDLDYQGPTNGYTPLHDTLWHGFDDCARVLIKAGARLDLLGHDGKTPLDIALGAFGPDHPIVALLRERAAAPAEAS